MINHTVITFFCLKLISGCCMFWSSFFTCVSMKSTHLYYVKSFNTSTTTIITVSNYYCYFATTVATISTTITTDIEFEQFKWLLETFFFAWDRDVLVIFPFIAPFKPWSGTVCHAGGAALLWAAWSHLFSEKEHTSVSQCQYRSQCIYDYQETFVIVLSPAAWFTPQNAPKNVCWPGSAQTH